MSQCRFLACLSRVLRLCLSANNLQLIDCRTMQINWRYHTLLCHRLIRFHLSSYHNTRYVHVTCSLWWDVKRNVKNKFRVPCNRDRKSRRYLGNKSWLQVISTLIGILWQRKQFKRSTSRTTSEPERASIPLVSDIRPAAMRDFSEDERKLAGRFFRMPLNCHARRIAMVSSSNLCNRAGRSSGYPWMRHESRDWSTHRSADLTRCWSNRSKRGPTLRYRDSNRLRRIMTLSDTCKNKQNDKLEIVTYLHLSRVDAFTLTQTMAAPPMDALFCQLCNLVFSFI